MPASCARRRVAGEVATRVLRAAAGCRACTAAPVPLLRGSAAAAGARAAAGAALAGAAALAAGAAAAPAACGLEHDELGAHRHHVARARR